MIYLHLGVHKTATTYLQDLLAANQGKMASIGRAYWALSQIRPALADLLGNTNWSEAGVQRLKTDPSSPLFRFFEFVLAKPDCVISDENILGFPAEAIDGEVYPRASIRLRRLRQSLGNRRVEVWLCLRAYDEFLASSYSEALRSGYYYASIEDFTQRNRTMPDGRWPALVDVIRERFPDSRMVIWDYEDFRPLLQGIVSRLSGLAYDTLHHLRADARLSLSAQAIEAHCAQAAEMNQLERLLSIAQCEETYPRSAFPGKFYPWSPHQAEAMKQAYRDDLAEIRQRPYVEFLSP